MLVLIGIAFVILTLYVLAKVLEWRNQDKHNDNYDRRKGGK